MSKKHQRNNQDKCFYCQGSGTIVRDGTVGPGAYAKNILKCICCGGKGWIWSLVK